MLLLFLENLTTGRNLFFEEKMLGLLWPIEIEVHFKHSGNLQAFECLMPLNIMKGFLPSQPPPQNLFKKNCFVFESLHHIILIMRIFFQLLSLERYSNAERRYISLK